MFDQLAQLVCKLFRGLEVMDSSLGESIILKLEVQKKPMKA